jgi:hypothetical protein
MKPYLSTKDELEIAMACYFRELDNNNFDRAEALRFQIGILRSPLLNKARRRHHPNDHIGKAWRSWR